MILETLVVGSFMENTYIVASEKTKEAAVIDPGADSKKILASIEKLGVNVKYILITHGHIDHIGAVARVKEATGATYAIHPNDIPLAKAQRGFCGAMPGVSEPPEPDLQLKEGDVFSIGEFELKVVETPGHTPGGVSFVGDGVVFSGDTLFQGSVGRTDFPGGDWDLLLDRIRTRLFVLPDDTVVLSGHGPETTIKQEKLYNPFAGTKAKLWTP